MKSIITIALLLFVVSAICQTEAVKDIQRGPCFNPEWDSTWIRVGDQKAKDFVCLNFNKKVTKERGPGGGEDNTKRQIVYSGSALTIYTVERWRPCEIKVEESAPVVEFYYNNLYLFWYLPFHWVASYDIKNKVFEMRYPANSKNLPLFTQYSTEYLK